MDLHEASQELEALRSEIAELDALESPTEEQTARFAVALEEWDTKKAAFDAANARAQKVAAVREAALDPANVERAFHAPQVSVRTDPFADLEAVARGQFLDDDLKSRAITALEQTARGIEDGYVEEAVRKVEGVEGAARHVLLTSSPAYRSAFRAWGRSGGQPIYSPEEAAAVRAALAISTGSTGGFLAPALLDPSIILTAAVVTNPIRQLARVVTGTAPTWNGVAAGAGTAYWTAEATAMTEGSPTLAQPSITAHKSTAYFVGSFEVWEDTNLQTDLIPNMAEAFDTLEGIAFVSGSGSGAPFGIVTAVSGTAGSLVTATTRGAFTSASAADVFAMADAVSPRFEDRSNWVANKVTFNKIRQMAGSNSGLYWTDLNGSTPASLLGYGRYSSSAVTSSTTSGNHIAILGDFSRYVIYDRLGTFLELNPIVVNGDGNPTGQRGLVAHKRIGANVTDVNAFRLLKT